MSDGTYPVLFVANKGRNVLLGREAVMRKEKCKQIKSLKMTNCLNG
ncbi:hypothetical protein PO124_03240 [Bacillus licheniformis]|nr:hypothetical protein [Bacillus licheniformis]